MIGSQGVHIGKPAGRRGFTLIEMLAATVVMSMLLIALANISRSSARQAQRADALRVQYPSTAIVADQITRDIRNADGYSEASGGITLFGAISTHPSTGYGTHRIAVVTYAVRDVRGVPVLFRTEQQPSGVGHQRIVWMETGGLSVSSSGPTVPDADPNRTGGLTPLPATLNVELSNSNGDAIWSQRIRHHLEVR